MTSLRVFRAEEKEEVCLWNAAWRECASHEVFALPEYTRIFCNNRERALCLYWREEQGGVLLPLIMRPLYVEPWQNGECSAVDLISPYGYGGPFVWGKADIEGFWDAFHVWALENGAVSCFIRISLFYAYDHLFKGKIIENSINIVRSLDLSSEEIWMDYEHKVRKNVNKARREGVQVEIDPNGKRLDEFLNIYYSTMDRRSAARTYYFDRTFFDTLIRTLKGNYAFFHAMHDNKIISTELVLISEKNIYSFLGGTIAESFELRPNDLLKHEIILWGQRNGKKSFVMGGGYDGQDGIFRYKQSFAPEGQVPFRTGRIIFDQKAYDFLVKRRSSWEAEQGREWKPNDDYFPAYRR